MKVFLSPRTYKVLNEKERIWVEILVYGGMKNEKMTFLQIQKNK